MRIGSTLGPPRATLLFEPHRWSLRGLTKREPRTAETLVPTAASPLPTLIFRLLYHRDMTQLEALYRYEGHPTETTMGAMGNLREVYGIRRIKIDEEWKTIHVEYDATRLAGPTIFQLLRRTGLAVVEELPLIPPQEAAPAEPAPAKS
jgi:hypothetical protein